MRINAVLNEKVSSYTVGQCEVVKVVSLTREMFAAFSCNLLREWDFISENLALLLDASFSCDNSVTPCLLVVGEGSVDGILVYPGGTAVALYSAYVANASDFLKSQSVTAFETEVSNFTERFKSILDSFVCDLSLSTCKDASFELSVSDVKKAVGKSSFIALDWVAWLSAYFRNRADVKAFYFSADGAVVRVYLKNCTLLSYSSSLPHLLLDRFSLLSHTIVDELTHDLDKLSVSATSYTFSVTAFLDDFDMTQAEMGVFKPFVFDVVVLHPRVASVLIVDDYVSVTFEKELECVEVGRDGV